MKKIMVAMMISVCVVLVGCGFVFLYSQYSKKIKETTTETFSDKQLNTITDAVKSDIYAILDNYKINYPAQNNNDKTLDQDCGSEITETASEKAETLMKKKGFALTDLQEKKVTSYYKEITGQVQSMKNGVKIIGETNLSEPTKSDISTNVSKSMEGYVTVIKVMTFSQNDKEKLQSQLRDEVKKILNSSKVTLSDKSSYSLDKKSATVLTPLVEAKSNDQILETSDLKDCYVTALCDKWGAKTNYTPIKGADYMTQGHIDTLASKMVATIMSNLNAAVSSAQEQTKQTKAQIEVLNTQLKELEKQVTTKVEAKDHSKEADLDVLNKKIEDLQKQINTLSAKNISSYDIQLKSIHNTLSSKIDMSELLAITDKISATAKTEIEKLKTILNAASSSSSTTSLSEIKEQYLTAVDNITNTINSLANTSISGTTFETYKSSQSTYLTTVNNQMTTDLTSLKTTIASLGLDVSMATTNLSTVQQNLESYKQSQQSIANSLQSELSTLKTTVASKTDVSVFNTYKEQTSQLLTALQELVNKNKALTDQQIATATTAITNLKTETATNIANLQTSLDVVNTTLTDKIDTTQKELTTYATTTDQTIQDLQTMISNLDNTKASKTELQQTAQTINDALNLRIDSLQNTISAKLDVSKIGPLKIVIADNYASGTSYTAGQYCIYNSKLYSCILDTTGEWNPDSWSESANLYWVPDGPNYSATLTSELLTSNSSIQILYAKGTELDPSYASDDTTHTLIITADEEKEVDIISILIYCKN